LVPHPWIQRGDLIALSFWRKSHFILMGQAMWLKHMSHCSILIGLWAKEAVKEERG
jgi:hypothetical protein